MKMILTALSTVGKIPKTQITAQSQMFEGKKGTEELANCQKCIQVPSIAASRYHLFMMTCLGRTGNSKAHQIQETTCRYVCKAHCLGTIETLPWYNQSLLVGKAS